TGPGGEDTGSEPHGGTIRGPPHPRGRERRDDSLRCSPQDDVNTHEPALIGEGLLLGRNNAMDVTNDSDTDTRYTVKNGSGSGMGGHHSFPFQPADTTQWKVLAKRTTDHVDTPGAKGPWIVYFYVNDQGFVANATSDN